MVKEALDSPQTLESVIIILMTGLPHIAPVLLIGQQPLSTPTIRVAVPNPSVVLHSLTRAGVQSGNEAVARGG